MLSSDSIVSWGAPRKSMVNKLVSHLFSRPRDSYVDIRAAPQTQEDLEIVDEFEDSGPGKSAMQGNRASESGIAAQCEMLDEILALSLDQPQHTETDRQETEDKQ